MALARWNGVVQDAEGNAVSGAQIEVRNEATGGLAPLYADRDGAVGLGNPYVASGPDIAFHARGGNYRITASKGTELKTWRWVAIGTSQGVDVEDLIVGLQAGIITAQTLAELDANAPETPDPGITPAPRGGVVWNDPNPALNGYYTYNYTATEWEYARPLPDTFAKVLLSGTGTAQTGVLAAGVSPAGIEVFFAKVAVPNTGAMTLSINGGPPRPVVNLAGNPLAAGEWAGMVMFYLNEDGQYQLLIDAGAAQAAAASASFADERADDAEAAATRAENAASSFSEIGTNFKTVANLLADTTLGYAGSSADVEVDVGDIVTAHGFRYEVAASDATDAHVETAGGVKLYVLKKNGCWYAEAFGVVTGDWVTDGSGDKVDCTAEFQAAINVLKSRETLKLPGGTIYIGDVTVPYGVLQVTFEGEGNFVPSTVIQFLPGAAQGFRLSMEAYAFKSISFRGLGNTAGAALFTSVRNDNYVDMDWSFEDCVFSETYHVGKLLGRGLTVDKCLYGTVYGDAWMLDYPNPSDVILAPPGYLGTLAGGFRGFVNRNCRFHGLFGYLFNVTGENAENARGFEIVGNQWDISPRFIKGSAQDAVVTGNACYVGSNTAIGTAFDMNLIRGLVVSGNLISNSTMA